MRRVLIAGCGYVGAATADLFHDAGWGVEGWTSSPASAAEQKTKPYPVRAVDLTVRAEVVAAAERFDAVIQCASSRGGNADDYRRIYLQAARTLRTAFPEALLLFASSTSVYAQRGGEWVTEQSAAEPERATARVLRETEEFVLESGGIVARLAGIYGPGRSALLRRFLAGLATIDPGPERFINQVHRDDVASAFFFLTEKGLAKSLPGASAERLIFNVTDGHPLTQKECYQWLAARLQLGLPPVAGAPAARRRGDSNKRVSSAKLQALGWSPRYPTFQSAMAESILPAW